MKTICNSDVFAKETNSYYQSGFYYLVLWEKLLKKSKYIKAYIASSIFL